MVFRIGKAIAYAVLIWVVGFIWGSFVFMTPSLKSTPPIPYISSNPAISFPILAIWLVLTYVLARSFLKAAADPVKDGFRLGVIFALVNVVLDLVVLVVLLKAGFGYFFSLSVWTAYAILIIVPWLTGRSVEKMR
jgi:uncharacterized membrane protein (DUF441 family)